MIDLACPGKAHSSRAVSLLVKLRAAERCTAADTSGIPEIKRFRKIATTK